MQFLLLCMEPTFHLNSYDVLGKLTTAWHLAVSLKEYISATHFRFERHALFMGLGYAHHTCLRLEILENLEVIVK